MPANPFAHPAAVAGVAVRRLRTATKRRIVLGAFCDTLDQGVLRCLDVEMAKASNLLGRSPQMGNAPAWNGTVPAGVCCTALHCTGPAGREQHGMVRRCPYCPV
ncbi:hypothetical protein BP5796_02592 [Coleophoma crateriformis]|uniref:Uncharacterized protein n=1 Tax=Coleophoma crateriformis TaxID=565419 RepID=A0A3D8SYM6_9HELO|nr:hypothetical protein BP5796_02592 [Coleophoma crateriformis]